MASSSSSPAPSDITKCYDQEDPSRSCNRLYKHKEHGGLCARCLTLNDVRDDPVELEKQMAIPFCRGCGAPQRFLNGETKYCGLCEDKEMSEQQSSLLSAQTLETRNLLHAKEVARKEAMANRTTSFSHNSGRAGTVNPQSTTSAAAPGSREIKIFFQAHSPGTTIALKTGLAVEKFPEGRNFHECIDYLLKFVNVPWEQQCKKSLTREHLVIRLHSNVSFHPGSDLTTLGNFFDRNEEAKRAPKEVNCKTPYVYLQALVQFEKDKGVDVPTWAKTEKQLQQQKKRKAASHGDEDLTSSVPKKVKGLVSTWKPRIPAGAEMVKLLFGTLDNDTIEWPATSVAEIPEPTVAYLNFDPFEFGATKQVFRMIIDGQEFAAKRFYNIGQGKDMVTPDENQSEVEGEALRLDQCKQLLEEFYTHAKGLKVTDIATDIKVTGFQIAAEAMPDNGYPSVASGISSSAWDKFDSKPRVTWLIEPMRNSSTGIKKWSGTMEHPDHNNKIGATLASFVHFAYVYTHQSVVFADLQTSLFAEPGAEGYNILFDMMSHTLTGNSGVGDHGLEGINTFVTAHKCDITCEDLNLSPLRDEAQHRNQKKARKAGRRGGAKVQTNIDSSEGEEA
ncbi:hypothetical protein V5O48_014997 [Marasmius crinis-equi]|uniref:Alpha-type protein kinase domain-containing protein n=1 Tax=Marasmius crinis-equi TaxID=585013 RepID=A0ABR3EVR1_9AGAR